MLSYDSQAHKDADKALLELARVALGVAGNAIRLDECELWFLRGKKGRITTWGDGSGYLLHLYARSRRAWGFAKRRLDFAVVTQDADGEGVLRFELPVTPAQAAEIRELTGFHKEPDLTEDHRAMLVEQGKRAGFGRKNGREPEAGYLLPDAGERVLEADAA